MKVLKKIIVVVLISVMGVGIADAKLRFGIKAGVNINNLSTSVAEIKDNACGFTGGLMADLQIPMIGLGFDLSAMYTRMNSVPTVTDFSQSEGGDFQLEQNKNFLEIPLNVKYKISIPVVGRVFAPYIFTGPSFAFKLGKTDSSYLDTKTTQVAWNVGLGIELVSHLQIGASYGFGINNIVDATGILKMNTSDLKVKNNYWTITAAYLF